MSHFKKLFQQHSADISPIILTLTTFFFSRDNGFADNLSTHSLVAGLWSSFYSLGEVLGPTIGGALVEYFGFPAASTSFAALNMFLALFAFVFFFLDGRTTKEIPSGDVSSKKHDLVKKDLGITENGGFSVEKFLKNSVRIKSVKTK